MGDTRSRSRERPCPARRRARTWDADTARLWWVDITGERVHCFDPESGQRRLLGHRRPAGRRGPRARRGSRSSPAPEGLAVLDRGTGRAGPARADRAGPAREPRQRRQGRRPRQGLGRHDGLRQAAAQRRACTGSTAARSTCVVDGLTISNGPAFDEARGRLYLADTALCRRRRVRPGPGDRRPVRAPALPRLQRRAGLAGRHDRRRRGHALGRAGTGRRRPPVPPRRHARRHRRASRRATPPPSPSAAATAATSTSPRRGPTATRQRADQPLAGAIFRCRPGVTGRPSPRLADLPADRPHHPDASIEKGRPHDRANGPPRSLRRPHQPAAAARGRPAGRGRAAATRVHDRRRLQHRVVDRRLPPAHRRRAGEARHRLARHPRRRRAAMLSFQPGDVTQAEDVSRADRRGPPGHAGLPRAAAVPASSRCCRRWPRRGLRTTDAVAIEKPFGTDLASAQHLNEILRLRLPEPTIFRIDHFLSNELVRRVVTLRFLNRVFEPVLNAVARRARGHQLAGEPDARGPRLLLRRRRAP